MLCSLAQQLLVFAERARRCRSQDGNGCWAMAGYQTPLVHTRT